PASARHRYPVLRPIPICRQAATVGTPPRISFQYSSSNTKRRLRPRRVISTPLELAGVLRQALEPARRHGVSFHTSPTQWRKDRCRTGPAFWRRVASRQFTVDLLGGKAS